MSRGSLRLAALAAGLFASGAIAQEAVKPQPRDPNMPSPQNVPPDKIEGRPVDSTGTLSERLERSDGVIRPPDPGTGRVIQPPRTDQSMPVIPPPGTPGSSRPNADPK